MLSGSRMPSSSPNFSDGMILPRAMPAMSGMMASTSEMPWSLRNCRISFAMVNSLSLTILRPGARRLAELGEQRHRKRVAHDLPLGVPLHGEREARRGFHAEGLDQPIGRARLDREVGPQPVDALPVQRIHLDALLARELPQQRAGFQQHVVRRSVLHVERLALVLAVIIHTGELVHALM